MSLRTSFSATGDLLHGSSSGDPDSHHTPPPLFLPFDIDQGFYSPGRVLLRPFDEILRDRACRAFVDIYKKGSITAQSSFLKYYTDMVAAHLDARQQDRLDFKYAAENVRQVSFDSFDFIADICRDQEECDGLDIHKELRALDSARKEMKEMVKMSASPSASGRVSSHSSDETGPNQTYSGVLINGSLPWELVALIELQWVNLGPHFSLGVQWKTREAIYQTIWGLHAACRLRGTLVGKAQVNEFFGRILVLRDGWFAVEVTRQMVDEGAKLCDAELSRSTTSDDRQIEVTLTLEQFDKIKSLELPNKLISDHKTWAIDEAGKRRFHAFYLSMFWLASQNAETRSTHAAARAILRSHYCNRKLDRSRATGPNLSRATGPNLAGSDENCPLGDENGG